MYEFPYGGEQQLNLNWIINEIITLHKRLDPDYELPNFDNAFPYMNLNQLNLDWILRELKAIKDLAPAEDSQLLKMVANALIANTYDAETQYNVDDIVYRDSDNRLYKCITATPAGGEPFDSDKWVEVDVGEVLTDLLVNGGTANTVTNVRYNDHKIQQEINGTYSDVITIEDAPTDASDRLPSSKAVYNLNGAINSKQDALTFDNVPTYNSNNPVKSTGIFSNMNNKFARVETGSNASRSYEKGEYVVVNGNFYKTTTAIPNGTAFAVGTNIELTTVGAELFEASKSVTFNFAVGASTFMRVHSTQRKIVIPIPLGYTQATVTYYNNNNLIKARKFDDYTQVFDFTGTTITTTINGPTLFVWLNGTGLENYGDLLASQGDLTITISK